MYSRHTLWINNLPYDIRHREMEKEFGYYGELRDVIIPTAYNGPAKGFAYVEFERNMGRSQLENGKSS